MDGEARGQKFGAMAQDAIDRELKRALEALEREETPERLLDLALHLQELVRARSGTGS